MNPALFWGGVTEAGWVTEWVQFDFLAFNLSFLIFFSSIDMIWYHTHIIVCPSCQSSLSLAMAISFLVSFLEEMTTERNHIYTISISISININIYNYAFISIRSSKFSRCRSSSRYYVLHDRARAGLAFGTIDRRRRRWRTKRRQLASTPFHATSSVLSLALLFVVSEQFYKFSKLQSVRVLKVSGRWCQNAIRCTWRNDTIVTKCVIEKS